MMGRGVCFLIIPVFVLEGDSGNKTMLLLGIGVVLVIAVFVLRRHMLTAPLSVSSRATHAVFIHSSSHIVARCLGSRRRHR